MFVMQNIFILRAIHFSIGHSFLVEFFVLKATSSRMLAISAFLDAWNSNQRSTSILG
jgi:hypothetical protein